DVDAQAHFGVAIAAPRAVDVRGQLDVEALGPSDPGRPGEQHAIGRADHEARRQGVGLVPVVHLQLEADVPHRHGDPQGAPRADGELAAHIQGVRYAVPVGKVAAVTGTVDDELDQLVVDAQEDRARQRGGVGREELDVAGRNARDGIAGGVGALQVAVVDEVHRAAQHAEAVRGEV